MAKELIFYSLASFLWLFGMAVVTEGFPYEGQLSAVCTRWREVCEVYEVCKPFTGCSWQVSEGSDSHDHILIVLTRCSHGSFRSEGLHAQVKLVKYRATTESDPKVAF